MAIWVSSSPISFHLDLFLLFHQLLNNFFFLIFDC
uniref:Uncharacterized protein n=1 Tax=Anguilla anguilla TaxID=7936 RepID=A0A0E9PWF8_ANGAN